MISLSVAGTKLAPGTHTLTVAYAGVAGKTLPARRRARSRSCPPVSVTTGKLAATTIRTTAYPKITAKVTASASRRRPSPAPSRCTTAAGPSRRSPSGGQPRQARHPLPKLAKGTHKIKVLYSGNSKVAKSTSPAYTLVVK